MVLRKDKPGWYENWSQVFEQPSQPLHWFAPRVLPQENLEPTMIKAKKGGHLTCVMVDSQGLPSKQVLVTRQQGRCQRFQHPAIPLTSWLPHIHLWNKPLFIFHSIFTITYLLSFHGCCCYSKPCLAKLLWFSSSVQIFAEPVFDKRFTHPTLQHSACQSACHLETFDQRQDLYLS